MAQCRVKRRRIWRLTLTEFDGITGGDYILQNAMLIPEILSNAGTDLVNLAFNA